MNYQRIRYFLAAAQMGSFSKAAAASFISAQALTKQISLLEDEIGGALFVRTPKGITLTELGQYAYDRLSKIDLELSETISQIKHHALAKREQINIGFFASLPPDTLVTPLITYLLGSYPEYQINLNMVELNEGKEMMLHGSLDLLFTNTHEEDNWNGFTRLSFGTHPAKIVVSLLHPWATKEEVTTADLKKETFLKMHMNPDHYTLPLKETFYENIPCKSIKELGNFHTLLALLQQGEGFAVFPQVFAHMDQLKIKCFDFPGRDFSFYTAMVCENSGQSDGLRQIINDIKEEYDLVQL